MSEAAKMERNKFLHGTLEVTIFNATPYITPFPLNCLFANGKPTYVTMRIDNEKVAKTRQEKKRVWNQTFQIKCAHPSDATITITMKTKLSVIGKLHFQANHIVNQTSLISGFFPLVTENGKPIPNIKLQLLMWFRPAEYEPSWKSTLQSGQYRGLQNATFPLRSNCHLTLYQDTHHCSTFQPPLHLCGKPRKLWEDIYEAIDGASHLVYITAWSFNPELVLVRDPETEIPHALGIKLGELLKRKAEEGVAVRIMIWDDETSLPVIKNKGMMGTNDEEARVYFAHTKVICRLCPRSPKKFPPMFSHHQKTISVDTWSQNTREIKSFIGGLDLCDGRYDTEKHSLFRTLNTQFHSHDFYQSSIAGASLQKGGPREPWHDVHACVTGEAAWDILTNFEQRWSKQCDPSLLISTATLSNLCQGASPPCTPQDRDWNIQVYRSINYMSATHVSENFTYERSIHEAYIDAIRRAERFIYIENQYFIGGCHLWDKDQHCGSTNLIPVEIALKVASKIRAKERFAVYIVIPMRPEGLPDSEVVKDILHWTRNTMEMMYKLIGEAILESRQALHPKDYLNFFCLANREERGTGELIPPDSPEQGTEYWNAQKHRRFMVYVHSKLMIVDDLYILIGSANVNQRSLDGKRDTEIAIGCYQSKEGEFNHRDIQKYRMSLWYEHTGQAEVLFQEPQKLECVQSICSIGERMWGIYSQSDVTDMEAAHLVCYPVNVKADGSIEEIAAGGSTFPDTRCPIEGQRSKILPPIFTT